MRKLATALITLGFLGLPTSALAAENIEDTLAPPLAACQPSVEVTKMPAGANVVHIAEMEDINAKGLKYRDVMGGVGTVIKGTPTDPVIDVQAATTTAHVGGWAGRKTTNQACAPEETQAEKEARELREKEAAEKAQKEKEEREKIEKEKGARMVVGIDAGGWNWESAVNDFSGAVKYVRSSAKNYPDDAHMNLLAKNGTTLLPLFGWNEAGKIVSWFQRYGKGGTFWAGKTDLGATTAEIVNEPGNPYLGGSRTNQPKYAAYIEEVNRAIQVLTFKPQLLVSYDGGFEGDNYGRVLVADDPNLKNLNICWTVHPYGGHGSNSAQGNRARVTEALHPVCVTEVGWPTAVGKSPTGDSLQWTEQQQANNITEFIRWAAGLGYVNMVVDFNYADYEPNNYYGIVNTSGTRHKVSYGALAQAAKTW